MTLPPASSATQTRLVTAVVVHYNAVHDLDACLASLATSQGLRVDVVVVDNSTDESARNEARALSENVGASWLPMDGNVGFAAAVNAGVATATTPLTFLLNQDATIHPETIAVLAATLEERPAALGAGPVVVTPDQRVWFAGGAFDRSSGRLRLDLFGADRFPDDVRRTGFISGCAVLVRSSEFRDLGGFDERFFLYWEDVEFGERARMAGHELLIVGSTTVVHRRGQAGDSMRNLSPVMLEHTLRSRRRFGATMPRRERAVIAATQPLEAARLLAHALRARPRSAVASTSAILRGLVRS